jgi:hypothetical protein
MTILNFSIDFTEAQLTGIAQARTAYNAISESQLTDSEYLEYVLLGAANSYAAQYSGSAPVPPSPIAPVADWDGLLSAILGGDLFSIYARLTSASFIDPAIATDALLANANNIAVASGKLDQAVQVTKVEAAVAASFQMLIASSNYRFTAEEKSLWDATVTALNFSQAMFLP